MTNVEMFSGRETILLSPVWDDVQQHERIRELTPGRNHLTVKSTGKLSTNFRLWSEL